MTLNKDVAGGTQVGNIRPDFLSHLAISSAEAPYNGRLTGLNIWARALTSEQVAEEAACRDSGPRAGLLDWGTVRLLLGDGVTTSQLVGGRAHH